MDMIKQTKQHAYREYFITGSIFKKGSNKTILKEMSNQSVKKTMHAKIEVWQQVIGLKPTFPEHKLSSQQNTWSRAWVVIRGARSSSVLALFRQSPTYNEHISFKLHAPLFQKNKNCYFARPCYALEKISRNQLNSMLKIVF